jgi:Phage protein
MQVDLTGEWYGWKQRGRYLVSPEGDRLTLERMKGIAWRLDMEARLSAARNRNASRKAVSQGLVKVVVVDLADWHAQRFGTRAG